MSLWGGPYGDPTRVLRVSLLGCPYKDVPIRVSLWGCPYGVPLGVLMGSLGRPPPHSSALTCHALWVLCTCGADGALTPQPQRRHGHNHSATQQHNHTTQRQHNNATTQHNTTGLQWGHNSTMGTQQHNTDSMGTRWGHSGDTTTQQGHNDTTGTQSHPDTTTQQGHHRAQMAAARSGTLVTH